MTQVRLGRKEERQRRHAVAAQRPPSPGPSDLAYKGGRSDPGTLLESVRAGFHDLQMLAGELHRLRYSDGIAEADWWRALYAPSLADIRKLPAAILDDKEMLPPPDCLPKTKDELRLWLERLMLANGRDANLDPLIEGWGEEMSPGRAFNQHVEELMKLLDTDAELYAALVGGRFAPVIRRLRSVDLLLARPLRKLLIRQSLIWCAHDVQMVFARLRKDPGFGDLIATGRTPMSTPERVLNQLRKRRGAIETLLSLFYGSDEWRHRDLEPPSVGAEIDLRRHPDPLIRRHAKWLRKRMDGELDGMTPQLMAALMAQIAAILRDDADPLAARTAQSRTMKGEPKSWPREHYHLSTLAAGAVTIRRLIQAEADIADLIDDRVSRTDTRRAHWALSPYPVEPPPGTLTRLHTLLNYYRDTMFDDPEPENDSDWQRRPIRALAESRAFLLDQGQRLLDDHHGDADDRRRSFYLLDVLPEHRLTMG